MPSQNLAQTAPVANSECMIFEVLYIVKQFFIHKELKTCKINILQQICHCFVVLNMGFDNREIVYPSPQSTPSVRVYAFHSASGSLFSRPVIKCQSSCKTFVVQCYVKSVSVCQIYCSVHCTGKRKRNDLEKVWNKTDLVGKLCSVFLQV